MFDLSKLTVWHFYGSPVKHDWDRAVRLAELACDATIHPILDLKVDRSEIILALRDEGFDYMEDQDAVQNARMKMNAMCRLYNHPAACRYYGWNF